VREVKSKVKSMLINFFDIKGIVHKQFVLAGKTVNSAYYCNLLWRLRKRVRKDFASKFEDKRIACCILLHQGILGQKQHGCVPYPLYFSIFPRLKLKLTGPHIDTTEVIETELQAVLNTFTEYDFQDAFQKLQKH
jgi:hypothetical protein